jgi:hypothetical protein
MACCARFGLYTVAGMNYTATLNMVNREMPKELNFDRQAFLLCLIFLLFMLTKYYSQAVKEVCLLLLTQISMAMTCLKIDAVFRPRLSRKVGIITSFVSYLSVFYEISGLLFRENV